MDLIHESLLCAMSPCLVMCFLCKSPTCRRHPLLPVLLCGRGRHTLPVLPLLADANVTLTQQPSGWQTQTPLSAAEFAWWWTDASIGQQVTWSHDQPDLCMAVWSLFSTPGCDQVMLSLCLTYSGSNHRLVVRTEGHVVRTVSSVLYTLIGCVFSTVRYNSIRPQQTTAGIRRHLGFIFHFQHGGRILKISVPVH